MSENVCPNCGSNRVVGLVESFWYSLDDWENSPTGSGWQSETEITNARMCRECDHEWDDDEEEDDE